MKRANCVRMKNENNYASMSSFTVVIPARLASTRLPNKPLANIHGKPMVVRVAERAARSHASEVVVATDHASVLDVCAAHTVRALMTSTQHSTGTDRLAEVVSLLGLSDDAIVVNVQGDEPLIAPEMIDAVANLLHEKSSCAIATASHAITSAQEFFNPNVVKVVCDHDGIAHYFSRAPIPYARDHFAKDQSALPPQFVAQRHIGIYAYRARFLKRFASLSIAPTESFEALEQLRAMYHGEKIAVLPWQGALAPGVDTPEDLAYMQSLAPERFG
jgi:3-deoxy-manno-octulosonate cytidylyltransferase (CMP-KDO synthetase)